jgi:hypothetical protein
MIRVWTFALHAAQLITILVICPLRSVVAKLRLRPDQDQARAWLAHSLTDRCVGSVRCHGDLGRPSVPMLVG